MKKGRNEESPDITPPLECSILMCWIEVVLDGLVYLGKRVEASNCLENIEMLLIEFPDQGRGMDILLWLPGDVFDSVALLLDFELKLIPTESAV